MDQAMRYTDFCIPCSALILTLVACSFVFHVAISPQGEDTEGFLSQARGSQPAAKKRRQSGLKADALRASHVRLFGDGGSVAALKRVRASAVKSRWWGAVQGFEQYQTQDPALLNLRVCVECATAGKDDAEINCGRDVSPQGAKQHIASKHKDAYADLLTLPTPQGQQTLRGHGFLPKERPWMEDLVVWIVMSNMPLSCVETPYFRQFLQ
jgi:hypothetical protein